MEQAACLRALGGGGVREVGAGGGASDGQRGRIVRARGVLLVVEEAQVVHLRGGTLGFLVLLDIFRPPDT